MARKRERERERERERGEREREREREKERERESIETTNLTSKTPFVGERLREKEGEKKVERGVHLYLWKQGSRTVDLKDADVLLHKLLSKIGKLTHPSPFIALSDS